MLAVISTAWVVLAAAPPAASVPLDWAVTTQRLPLREILEPLQREARPNHLCVAAVAPPAHAAVATVIRAGCMDVLRDQAGVASLHEVAEAARSDDDVVQVATKTGCNVTLLARVFPRPSAAEVPQVTLSLLDEDAEPLAAIPTDGSFIVRKGTTSAAARTVESMTHMQQELSKLVRSRKELPDEFRNRALRMVGNAVEGYRLVGVTQGKRQLTSMQLADLAEDAETLQRAKNREAFLTEKSGKVRKVAIVSGAIAVPWAPLGGSLVGAVAAFIVSATIWVPMMLQVPWLGLGWAACGLAGCVGGGVVGLIPAAVATGLTAVITALVYSARYPKEPEFMSVEKTRWLVTEYNTRLAEELSIPLDDVPEPYLPFPRSAPYDLDADGDNT